MGRMMQIKGDPVSADGWPVCSDIMYSLRFKISGVDLYIFLLTYLYIFLYKFTPLILEREE